MTDLPSIMDKIRILRSRRRKTYRGKIDEKLTSLPATANSDLNSEVTGSPGGRQWVPFLVLDVSQQNDDTALEKEKLTKNVTAKLKELPENQKMPPLTSPIKIRTTVAHKNIGTRLLTASDKTVIKTITTRPKRVSPRKNKSIPVACTIMVSSKDDKNNSKDKIKKVQISSLCSSEPLKNEKDSPSSPKSPVSQSKTSASLSSTKSQKDVEPLQSKDANFNTTTLAPVGCVICSKHFSTLTEMQAHYLSEHKNRRGRENRKRPIEGVNTEPQKMPDLVAVQEKAKDTIEEPGFKFPLYVNEHDPKCPVCSIAFKSSQEVKNHVRLVHSYRCSECSDTFYTLFEFTGHRCNKGAKKMKRIRKKSSRLSSVNQEVANAMKSFVPIQPNVNKNPKSKKETSPPVPHKDSDKVFVPISTSSSSVSNLDSNPINELQVNSRSKLQITSVTQQTERNIPIVRTPSPELTIAPLDNKPKATKIRVLETNNLRCFKFKKDDVEPETPISRSELIQEKIAQLKSNPNVSVSWIPKVKFKPEDDDSEYVCGRCNVICDDIDDYMDHIHDCLTMTCVTLEKTSNPPLRILKLQKEISSFGFQEANNNRYSVNKNLMKKLQEVIPLTEDDVRESSPTPTPHVKEAFRAGRSPRLFGLLNGQHLDKVPTSNNGNKDSRLQNPTLEIKEEPLDYDDDSESLSLETIPSSVNETASSIYQLRNSKGTGRITNSKGTVPMVIIPVDKTSASKLLGGSDLSPSKKQATKPPSPVSSSPSSPWDSSPLDLMIDTDDIKMEVEEEIVDDYENF